MVVTERLIIFFSVLTHRKNPNETDPWQRKSGQVAQHLRDVSITSRSSSIIRRFRCRFRDWGELVVVFFVNAKGPDRSFEEATPVGPSMDASQVKKDDGPHNKSSKTRFSTFTLRPFFAVLRNNFPAAGSRNAIAFLATIFWIIRIALALQTLFPHNDTRSNTTTTTSCCCGINFIETLMLFLLCLLLIIVDGWWRRWDVLL